MICACCGRDLPPAEMVPTLPKTQAVLCGECGEKWRGSADARLHAQAMELGRRDVAASQFQNFTAVRRMG